MISTLDDGFKVPLLLGKIVTLTNAVEEAIALDMDVAEDDTQLLDEIVPDDVTLLRGKIVTLPRVDAKLLVIKEGDPVVEEELEKEIKLKEVMLIVELDDTDIDALVQPEDNTLPD